MNHEEAHRMHNIKTKAGRLGFSIQESQVKRFYKVISVETGDYLCLLSLQHLEEFMNERWANRKNMLD